jgi:hypothetical protein
MPKTKVAVIHWRRQRDGPRSRSLLRRHGVHVVIVIAIFRPLAPRPLWLLS